MRVVPLFALLACAIAEEDFPDVYADTAGDRLYECNKSTFENLYGDNEDGDCQDQWASGAEFWMDAADLIGGEYDPDAARECINEINDAQCSDLTSSNYECDLYD